VSPPIPSHDDETDQEEYKTTSREDAHWPWDNVMVKGNGWDSDDVCSDTVDIESIIVIVTNFSSY
jgi:hypothetical protein